MHDFFREDIARHEARERFWMANGRPDFAEGSARKAQKWRAKARGLDILCNGSLPQDEGHMLIADKLRSVEQRLQVNLEYALYGHGSGPIGGLHDEGRTGRHRQGAFGLAAFASQLRR